MFENADVYGGKLLPNVFFKWQQRCKDIGSVLLIFSIGETMKNGSLHTVKGVVIREALYRDWVS